MPVELYWLKENISGNQKKNDSVCVIPKFAYIKVYKGFFKIILHTL